jgi:two-component system sensor histidine kinase MprB
MRRLDPSHAELVVSDHGPGIPEHERRLVFERFYRSTTARAMPGSGLGLAIVKKVVLNHGGLLRVEDTVPGGQPPGTSFYVLLPGRPMPVSAYSTSDAEREAVGVEDTTDPAVPLAGEAANSRESANVISVDSQSARAR